MIREIVSMASAHTDSLDRVSLAADIVSAYVSNNSVRTTDLPALITSVHSALTNLGAVNTVSQPEPERMPAVSVKKSITPDFLICLDDGKKFKSLKRHLSSLGMTPDQYRQKWKLPQSYPMVAPNYAATRSSLAKSMGLGQVRKDAPKRKSGRKPKAVAENAAS
jgi:predicted transcriptional regulator